MHHTLIGTSHKLTWRHEYTSARAIRTSNTPPQCTTWVRDLFQWIPWLILRVRDAFVFFCTSGTEIIETSHELMEIRTHRNAPRTHVAARVNECTSYRNMKYTATISDTLQHLPLPDTPYIYVHVIMRECMCECVRVCVCIYIYIYLNMYIYVNIYIYMYIYI